MPTDKNLRINIISETAMAKGQGVHTAFVKTLEELAKRPDLTLEVNSIRKADIIHVQSIGPLFWLLAAWRRTPKVITAHVIPESLAGSIIGSSLWMPIASWYIKTVYNKADLIIAVSPQVKMKLKEMNLKPEIAMIPNGVDIHQFFPSQELRYQYRKKLGLTKKEKVIVSSGQIQTRKGFEAFYKMAERFSECKFVWIGGRPFGRLTAGFARLNELIANKPDNLTITGVVPFEDMAGYYNAGDIFLFPSLQENLPFAVIEAAACHLPLVMRSLPEYGPTFGGYYLECDDHSFQDNLNKVITDRSTYNKYQELAAQLAQKYDLRNICDQILTSFRSLIQSQTQ